ncbi:MAG: hypothetical protein GY758_22540, partial [Fuerstiella sp.]|nr:hypothetical protein [Fuerstiella sp.]
MRLPAVFMILMSIPLVAVAQGQPESVIELTTVGDKVSYAVGLNIGRSLQQQGLEVNLKLLSAGIAAILSDTKPAMTDEQAQAAFIEYQSEKAKAGKEIVRKFLEENAKKKGVQQTKSGLQYLVLREGTGEKPTSQNTVSTHYRGKLINGNVFDESYKGEAPAATDSPVS